MLHDSTSRPSRRGVIALVTMLAVVAFVPYRLTARTPVPGEQSAPASAQRPQPPPAPASGPRAQPPAAPAASRPPKPVTPSKPSPAEEQQLSQAISDQRASMQQMEKALKALREQFHELLMQAEVARHAAELNDARISQAEAIRRAVEEQQSAQNTSRQLLARLDALMKEHEVTESRLRQLAAEIESVKQKLNEPF